MEKPEKRKIAVARRAVATPTPSTSTATASGSGVVREMAKVKAKASPKKQGLVMTISKPKVEPPQQQVTDEQVKMFQRQFEMYPLTRSIRRRDEFCRFYLRTVIVPREIPGTEINAEVDLSKEIIRWVNFEVLSRPWITSMPENPLLNEKILGRLFEFVHDRDLRLVRQVCKLWYSKSLNRWRRDNLLRVTLLDCSDLYNAQKCISLKELQVRHSIPANDFYQLAEIPYKNFMLYIWEFNDNGLLYFPQKYMLTPAETLKMEDRIKWFQSTFGDSIESISFQGCFFRDISTFLTAVLQFAPNMLKLKISIPVICSCDESSSGRSELYNKDVHGSLLMPNNNVKMKKLFIGYHGKTCERKCCRLPVPWLAFLNCFPNLEEIAFIQILCFSEVKKALKAIKEIQTEDASRVPLKSVNLMGSFQLTYDTVPLSIKNLLNFKSSIEILDIDLGVDTDESFIEDVVRPYSKQLKALSLTRAPFTARIYKGFLSNYSLKSMEFLSLSGPILSNLAFLRRMPNLKFLEIDAGIRPGYVALRYKEKHELGIAPVTYMGDIMAATRATSLDKVVLTKLMRIYISNELGEESIERLSALAPNIQILSIKLNNLSFSAVCANWPNLKKLELLKGSSVDDEGVTGFKCASFSHVPGKCCCCCPCPKMTKDRRDREFADITFLKNLRDFRAIEEQLGYFTEHSILQGFIWLPGSVYVRLKGLRGPVIIGEKVGYQTEITYMWEMPCQGNKEVATVVSSNPA